MNGTSLNILQDRLQKLKVDFPEIFTEGKIDTEKFKATFTDDINFNNERYVLNWAGKSDAFKVLQIPTTATLKPQAEQSVNFDTTENIFIEGENLEVLKVLQKSYYGKIKCIIIDPPYNTGNDSFIYPDSFKEKKAEYEKRIGDKDEEGYLMKEGMFRKNSKDSGHYHSNWLSMMYPRLFLAKNLLREDGVIFVHIDDNEGHNLRMIMNEIFGEENFVGCIVWKKKTNGNNMGLIPPVHDFILVYAKRIEEISESDFGFPLTDEFIKRTYSNPDNDLNGPWTTMDLSANHKGPYFAIKNPVTNEIHYPSEGRYWVFNEAEVLKRIKDGRIIFGKSGNGKPVQKVYLKDRDKKRNKAETWWDKHGLNADGTKELTDLFKSPKIFSHSKPSVTIKHLVNISTIKNNESIVLDFFSGSGSTAQAVLELNKEDNGNRKFILVQLPEPCDKNSEAYKAGYKTIADISKERIRRVIKKIGYEQAEQQKQKERQSNFSDKPESKQVDLGFKSFKLSPSNFKIWRSSEINGENLVQQLDAFTNPVREGSEQGNMLFELMLKAGYLLTDKVALRQVRSGKNFYSIKDGELIIAIDRISEDVINEIIALQPKKVITLDILFKDNDQLKTNTVLQMRDAGIDFKTI